MMELKNTILLLVSVLLASAAATDPTLCAFASCTEATAPYPPDSCIALVLDTCTLLPNDQTTAYGKATAVGDKVIAPSSPAHAAPLTHSSPLCLLTPFLVRDQDLSKQQLLVRCHHIHSHTRRMQRRISTPSLLCCILNVFSLSFSLLRSAIPPHLGPSSISLLTRRARAGVYADRELACPRASAACA